MTPTVSVLVTCYNKARYIEETLDSVRTQTFQDIELIIVDDASTDQSIEVIQSWINRYNYSCILLRHAQNRGLCASTNTALAASKGKYVALLDADDLYLCEKLEKQVAKMETCASDVGLLYHDASLIDENGRELPFSFLYKYGVKDTPPQGKVFNRMIKGNFLPLSATLIRKSCFHKVGIFDEALCYQDWDMWLRIAEHFTFSYLNEKLAKYRVTADSMSNTLFLKDRYVESNFRILEKAIHFKKIDTQERLEAKKMLYFVALDLYKRQHLHRGNYLKKSLKLYPNFKGFVCLMMTYLLPSAFEKRVVGWLKRRSVS